MRAPSSEGLEVSSSALCERKGRGRTSESVRVCAPFYRAHLVFHQRSPVPRGLRRPYKAPEQSAHPRSSRACRSGCSHEAQTTKGNEAKGDADALSGSKDLPCHTLALGERRCLRMGRSQCGE